ncbi:MAG: DMT family transporter [Oscillospiraceae bacterium]
MKKYLGMLGLLIVTIIWGGGFVASDIALQSLSPFQILTARFLIASVFMFFISFTSLKKCSKEEIKAGVILGFFLFGAFALQTIALLYTTPSKNAFLTATNVIFVPFIAFVIYKKKISLQVIMGAVVAIIGAGVLSLNDNFSIGIGDLLTLACAVCFAFQIFLTGKYVGQYRASVLNFFQMATAFVFSAIGLLFSGGLTQTTQVSQNSILSVLYLGIISTTLTYLLQTASQKYVDETKSAIILSLEAVFGTVFSVIILQELVTTKMMIGCILILSAVLISEVKINRKHKPLVIN